MSDRLLIGGNPAREIAAQQRALALLERTHRRLIAVEIRRASMLMVNKYAEIGAIPNLPDDHEARIRDAFLGMAEASIEMMGRRILEQGKAAGHDIERKDFGPMLLRLALEYIALEAIRARITSISMTTRKQIIALIEAGVDEGLGVQEVARSIARSLPGFSQLRGALIARTEIHGAANFGADGAARSTGLPLRKEWAAAGDERTRESHVEADGQMVEMNEPFIVGGAPMAYPGDVMGPPAETINCRCAVIHHVKGF